MIGNKGNEGKKIGLLKKQLSALDCICEHKDSDRLSTSQFPLCRSTFRL